jgi:hypothetical protein
MTATKAAALGLFFLTPPAFAAQEWVAIRIHSPEDRSSQIGAVTSWRQGGWRLTQDWKNPGGLWAGSAGTWQVLSPPGVDGFVYGMYRDLQSGNLTSSVAVIWQGTPH